MRFWDTSAIVTLLLREPAAVRLEELLRADEETAVWWCTETECRAALARAYRARRITAEELDVLSRDLQALHASWLEILPGEEVRKQARRLLRVHALRAADALRLAAAIAWSSRYDGAEFVCLDANLAEAARLEGFAVL